MLAIERPRSADPGGHRQLISMEAISPSNGRLRTGSAAAVALARPQPFAVDVQRRNDVAIVRPHGELDLATVATLRAALDGIDDAGRLVLDLRGLSFLDSTGLRLLVVLHQRAQRDGFQLMLVAPTAPADRAILLSGLDQVLPFVAADDAVDRDPYESTRSPHDGIR